MRRSMISHYDYVIIGFYLVFLVAIGLAFRRMSRNTSDYFRAGGAMPWWITGTSAWIFSFTAWTFTGAAGKIYESGTLVLIVFYSTILALAVAMAWTCGLDDGGVMYRMDEMFKDSRRTGNEWAAKVIPLLAGPRAREVALLFPAEMSLYEPFEVDVEGRHRMDLLGWYQQFTDLGWHVDIVHPDQAAVGALVDYQHLVVPHNSLYDLGDNVRLATAVKKFVADGGTMLHGPGCELVRHAFGIEESSAGFDCIQWREAIIPHGWSTVSFHQGTPIATYFQSGAPAITQMDVGSGRVLSFGFQYGYAYSRRTMPVVPANYGRREMHPLVLLKETPVAALIGASPQTPMPATKGVEAAQFGSKFVIVNHRAIPVDISSIVTARAIPQVPIGAGHLAAHSAIYLEG